MVYIYGHQAADSRHVFLCLLRLVSATLKVCIAITDSVITDWLCPDPGIPAAAVYVELYTVENMIVHLPRVSRLVTCCDFGRQGEQSPVRVAYTC
jgi:hypothetical protein